MKLPVAIVILLSFLAGVQALHAQSGKRKTNAATDEAQVRAILARQSEAWNRNDLEGFMSDYWKNDSLMFVGKSGVTYGWDKTLANYRKNYPDKAAMGKLTFRLLQVRRLSPAYFFVTGRFELQRLMGDLSGHFTLLVQRIGGRWVIVSDHSS